jgi:D-proline reductase (dithiol) PrdB
VVTSRLKNRILARVFTAFPSLAARWGKGLVLNAGKVPWAVPRLPLRQAVVGLVTTGGVHLTTQLPFDMTDAEGDPSFRELPVDTAPEFLTITHDYYDHRDAEADLNLVYPVQRLQEMQQAGALGSLHPLAYSLMGHIDGAHLSVLQEVTAVEIARRFARAGVDYVLLVPA